ncbi:DUF2087 domain-containing protein [Candidatus Woesearchaeota archaeon]|nr:DUF2087 domain-containing protein [Candidatus Woesearchaeota archaeon]
MSRVIFPFDTKKFFEKFVKHHNFPKNDFEKQAILLYLIEKFKDSRKYLEQEVNEILKKYFEDYTLLRRELINFGYMQRDSTSGEYWVVKRELTLDDVRNNALLRRHAQSFNVLDEDKKA